MALHGMMATMQDRRPWPCLQAKETTAHAGWALVPVPVHGAGRCMHAWHSKKCPCHSAEPSQARLRLLRACTAWRWRRRRSIGERVSPGAGGRVADDGAMSPTPGARSVGGMPFSGDRATARNQCEQQGKAFHVERARGKLRRNLHDGPSNGLSGIWIME
jgi:hypothetical protein